jgi:hypothetical protein
MRRERLHDVDWAFNDARKSKKGSATALPFFVEQ